MSTQIRTLSRLTPDMLGKAAEWLRLCGARGVPILVYETLRTEERQAELYAIGRTKPGRIVTYARPGESNHQHGRALDAVPWAAVRALGSPESKLDWDPFLSTEHSRMWAAQIDAGQSGDLSAFDERWRVMIAAADDVGMKWAGRWRTRREYVHFEIDG